MAGVLSRFSFATAKTIEELRNSSKNNNTVKSTSFWLSVWKKWCLEKGIADEIENYEPAELNTLLERFYAELKNKHGEDYEPESLKVMIVSPDRHLKNKSYSHSIVRDREFSSSKQVLDGKAKQLRLAGREKRPNKARQVSEEEEEILWKSEKLGGKNPESLIQTMWWLLTEQFGLRGRQEHHGMRLEDFRIMKGDDGLEFVEFTEGPTKTRPGGLNAKPRQFQPKMFQTGGEKCPVALFRQYISHRPPNLRTSGPFYLSIKYNRRPDDEIWYEVQPMGENKINSMMKNIISGTTLFSNHSARETLVTKMKKAKLERSAIAKVTGHRNIQSLDDYDESDEDEQRQLSWAISKGNTTPNTKPGAGSSHGSSATSAAIPHMMSSQAQNLMNSFTNCTVTFNLNSKTSPTIKPCKRRLHFIHHFISIIP